MSERDPVVTLLRELDGPAEPRPEFSEALRTRLLSELADANRARPQASLPSRRRVLPTRLRRPLLAGAAALAVAAAVTAAVVASRPSPASALDVIRQARTAFAHMPPFEATYKFTLNPDGSNPDQFGPKGATETVVISYGGPGRYRAEIVAEQPRLRDETRGPGSYDVYDGRAFGSYYAQRNAFNSFSITQGFQPLEYLSWHSAYPDWERICRSPGSKVLPEARILGRDVRHIRCGDFTGGFWELWIDRQTGLLLKIIGQVGGGDFFAGGGLRTSAKGGFAVERLRYNPAFPPQTFKVVAPPGALVRCTPFPPSPLCQERLQAADARVPPFRAVLHGPIPPGGIRSVSRLWWLNDHTWRIEVLAGDGAGNFEVAARGTVRDYNAHDHSYSSSPIASVPPPIKLLLPVGVINGYSNANCPIVGRGRIGGRDAVRRHCARAEEKTDVWVDRSTGLLLEQQALRVRSIVYHATFPPGTFRFVPPPGSISEQRLSKLAESPYYKTKLAPGKPAPNWHATTLAGKPFQLTDLRGKPTLLLLLPDWCGNDPACNDLAPLEQAYQKSNHRTQVVWVDILGGKAQGAKKLARLDHLTFEIVLDHKEASNKAWARFNGYPYWLLLDSRGRVIEARFKPQTVAQLEQLLAKAK